MKSSTTFIESNGWTEIDLILKKYGGGLYDDRSALRIETHYLTEKIYAYYVEVPQILIYGSNFQFIPPVEFLEIFQFFV